VCQSLNQTALESRSGRLEGTDRSGERSLRRTRRFWMQQHAKPMDRPICYASAKASLARRRNRYSREQLRMDIYSIWTPRAMTKLAQRKDDSTLSSSGITKSSKTSVVTRLGRKFESHELSQLCQFPLHPPTNRFAAESDMSRVHCR
jgi:hypothetical protein